MERDEIDGAVVAIPVVSRNSLDTPNIVQVGLKGLLNECLVGQVEQR